jgi:hypothetical protein
MFFNVTKFDMLHVCKKETTHIRAWCIFNTRVTIYTSLIRALQNSLNIMPVLSSRFVYNLLVEIYLIKLLLC